MIGSSLLSSTDGGILVWAEAVTETINIKIIRKKNLFFIGFLLLHAADRGYTHYN
jgi:hypothetical protein